MNRNPEVLDRLAPVFAPERGFQDLLLRKKKQERARKVTALALVTTIAAAFVAFGLSSVDDRTSEPAVPPDASSQSLGIFEPFAGQILFETGREIWGINPAATEPTPAPLAGQRGWPVGWSSDGTELLMIAPNGDLIILHADGTETLLPGSRLRSELFGAAISPDGSQVAYAATPDGLTTKLYAIDVDTARTTLLVEPSGLMVYQPTFSPDGTQIAYMDGGGDHGHRVWVIDVDGSDPHMIVENEVTLEVGHVFGLAWSPTGDRIALGLRRLPEAGIYTFAPNGSGFTRLIRDAIEPAWSSDGSQIAYESLVMLPCPENPDRCWSEDTSGGLRLADAEGNDLQQIGGAGVQPEGALAWNPAG